MGNGLVLFQFTGYRRFENRRIDGGRFQGIQTVNGSLNNLPDHEMNDHGQLLSREVGSCLLVRRKLDINVRHSKQE